MALFVILCHRSLWFLGVAAGVCRKKFVLLPLLPVTRKRLKAGKHYALNETFCNTAICGSGPVVACDMRHAGAPFSGNLTLYPVRDCGLGNHYICADV